jgi:hypothetical protein
VPFGGLVRVLPLENVHVSLSRTNKIVDMEKARYPLQIQPSVSTSTYFLWG